MKYVLIAILLFVGAYILWGVLSIWLYLWGRKKYKK